MQTNSLVKQLEEQLQNIEKQVLELFTNSSIERDLSDPFDEVMLFVNDYHWGEDNAIQKRQQLTLLKSYSAWFEHLRLLFYGSSREIQQQISQTDSSIRGWIEKENRWGLPRTIEDAKERFKEDLQVYYQLLQIFTPPSTTNIILVPDTNALIISPDVSRFAESIGQANYTVILISTVLRELDKLKRDHRDREFRNKVDSIIRRIKALRQQGDLREGVTVKKTVKVKMMGQEPKFDVTLSWLDPENDDDRIIATALEIQREEPSSVVILITADINHQNKAEMANLPYAEPPEDKTEILEQ